MGLSPKMTRKQKMPNTRNDFKHWRAIRTSFDETWKNSLPLEMLRDSESSYPNSTGKCIQSSYVATYLGIPLKVELK